MRENLLDPAIIMQIRSLELRARIVVQGPAAGANRSRQRGFSTEFSEHRPYDPGSDLRFLDWRLLARTDRAYIKQYEDETNLRAMLVLDVSRSMQFSSQPWSKDEFARTVIASLAYFLSQQRDAIGFATFDSDLISMMPARSRPGQFRRMLVELEQAPAGRQTNIAQPLDQLARRLTRRSLLIVVSDFLAPLAAMTQAVRGLARAGHEVIALQILDPAELALPDTSPAFWQDIETGRQIYVDPSLAAEDNSLRIRQHLAEVAALFKAHGAGFVTLQTSEDPGAALAEFLHLRSQATVQRSSNTIGTE